MIPLGLIVNWFGLVLVSPRRPRRPASLASFTTGFAPGLAGFVWASSRSRLVICSRQGRVSSIQLAGELAHLDEHVQRATGSVRGQTFRPGPYGLGATVLI